MSDFKEEDIKKMRDFFYEHPINSFDHRKIAEYLEMDEKLVWDLLMDMWENGVAVPTWKASLKFAYQEFLLRNPKEIIEKLYPVKEEDWGYEEKLECGCIIFKDKAGWHHTHFCKECLPEVPEEEYE